jgi:hypothetical protein
MNGMKNQFYGEPRRERTSKRREKKKTIEARQELIKILNALGVAARSCAISRLAAGVAQNGYRTSEHVCHLTPGSAPVENGASCAPLPSKSGCSCWCGIIALFFR